MIYDVLMEYTPASSCGRVTPQTAAGKAWIEENVDAEGYQWLGKTLVVEWRFLDNLLHGMLHDGLTVETRN